MTFSFNSRLLRKTHKAFTLVELLASAGIMLVVVSSTLGVTVNVMNTWNRATESLTMDRIANQVFALIQSDINGVVIKNDGGDWMYVSEFDDGSFPTYGHGDDSYFYFYSKASVRPRTYVSEGTETALQGSMCAVLYRMAWQNPFNTSGTDVSKKRYGLYRAVVDPEKLAATTTWSNLVDSSYTINGLLDEGHERDFSGTLLNYAKEPYNLVCERVVGFDAAILVGSAAVKTWIPSGKFKHPRTGVTQVIPAVLQQLARDGLNGCQVRIRIVSEEGADLLRHGNGSLTDPDFIKQYTKAYSRSFFFKMAPF